MEDDEEDATSQADEPVSPDGAVPSEAGAEASMDEADTENEAEDSKAPVSGPESDTAQEESEVKS